MSKAQGKVAMTFLQLIVTMASGLDMQCSQAAAVLAEAKELPEMVVFDLDYTLWPFWCALQGVHDCNHAFNGWDAVVFVERHTAYTTTACMHLCGSSGCIMQTYCFAHTCYSCRCEMYTTRDEPKLFPEARGVVDALKYATPPTY